MTTTPTSTKRIEYIDALRGFTMILVVFSHLYIPDITPLNKIFITFRMPLFFFISGFIAYKANEIWNLSSYTAKLLNKCRIQLIPTLVFGLLFSYIIRNHDLLTFAFDGYKDGYWFTIVLLGMFIIYYTYNLIISKLYAGGGVWYKNIILYVIAIVLWGLPYICGVFGISLNNSYSNLLCLPLLFNYFQFFVLGLIARQFQDKIHQIIENKYFSACIIILFIALFWWLQIDSQHINNSIGLIHRLLLLINIIGRLLVRYLGLIIVYSFFRKYQTSFTQATKIGSSLQYIGRHTLDIYVLHYFFLPNIAPIKEFILNTQHTWNSPNIVFELFFGVSVALMVIAMCLLVSKVLRTSDILAHFLFGAKIKKEETN